MALMRTVAHRLHATVTSSPVVMDNVLMQDSGAMADEIVVTNLTKTNALLRAAPTINLRAMMDNVLIQDSTVMADKIVVTDLTKTDAALPSSVIHMEVNHRIRIRQQGGVFARDT